VRLINFIGFLGLRFHRCLGVQVHDFGGCLFSCLVLRFHTCLGLNLHRFVGCKVQTVLGLELYRCVGFQVHVFLGVAYIVFLG
jgi:hypothetical protein